MKAVFHILIASALFQSIPAHALEGEETRCLERTPQQIHTWLVNYSNYANLDDRIGMNIPGVGRRQLVNMVRSSEGAANTHNASGSRGSVAIFMRPMYVETRAIYPRFKLNCHSSASDDSFTHHCELDHSADPSSIADPVPLTNNYAVSAFTVDVDAQANGSGCAAGQSRLHYRFTVSTIESHVSTIKDAALTGLLGSSPEMTLIGPALRGFMDAIFGDSFFGWYFREFYGAWADAIPAS